MLNGTFNKTKNLSMHFYQNPRVDSNPSQGDAVVRYNYHRLSWQVPEPFFTSLTIQDIQVLHELTYAAHPHNPCSIMPIQKSKVKSFATHSSANRPTAEIFVGQSQLGGACRVMIGSRRRQARRQQV